MADLIVTHSKIWTGNPEQPFAEAIAIKADTILAVGSNEDILALKSSDTKVVESPGKLILPGFIDSHVHFLTGGFGLSSVQLKDAATKDEFIGRIREFAKTMKPGEWMLEGNWDHENWGGELPGRSWIDSITKDIPVFVNRSDGHMALANSAALKAAGITDEVGDVVGGEIERYANGELTGLFKDNAMSLVSSKIPDYSAKQYDEALQAAMEYAASHGVTSVHHMGTMGDIEVFERARKANRLKTRIYATAPIPDHKEILQKMEDWKSEGLEDDAWLKIGGAKLFADGSLGSHTAAFREPYTDEPDYEGILMDSEESMRKQIILADSLGLQVVVHAIGDRANHIILDDYEEAIRINGPRDRRMRIEHAQHLLPEDLHRFGELGVIASMQPWHLMDDGRWNEKYIGSERINRAFCFNTLLNHKTTLAFGSDWAVAPAIPLTGIHAAVNRQTLDGKNPEGWVPQEKISVEESLFAYTINGAYASFEEHIKGTLVPGKLADLVVLDQDIIDNPETIPQTNVVLTIASGQTVYSLK